ncbi:MAG: hypothetical protein H6662_06730 [Ardenticatenaceae bacterium]|nr:hypothetical protein [Anaerolineales bacterium]MCB8921260.1 hypothetical protein [Ardenticatenaceae bacterium]MCB8990626.1 hypothetical protein [Ardenticatenaceae bacterium]MCB9004333.1 hypothetical protein [Ardenticatenaceae bacterium]
MKRKIRYVSGPTALLFIVGWLAAFALLTGRWPNTRPDGEYKTITNTEYGFTVDYPTKWSAQIYGEYGLKGADQIKLRIAHSVFDQFVIYVNYQRATKPTLQEVIDWGNELTSRFRSTQESIAQYEEFGLQYDMIQDTPIARLRYRSWDRMYEDIYIARSNDMIIITLQAPKGDFDSYLEDFNAIVASFRPLE